MTRTIRTAVATALAVWLAGAGSLAFAADDAPAVDPATAEAAAAQGAVCPTAQLQADHQAEEVELRRREAIQQIGEEIAAHAAPDPEIRVLNGTGYNYESVGALQRPSPAPPH